MRLTGLRVLTAIPASAAVAVVALLGAGTAAATPSADPAVEPTDGPAATSTLQSVTPTALTPDDDGVTLTGTVHNTGDETLVNVQVLPRFSGVPVQSRSEIRTIATDETLYWGSRHIEGYQVVADTLEPGQTDTFTITLSTELLDFEETGVYAVGVDVLASDSDDRVRVSTSRTVVPWLNNPDDLPTVPVAVLWPLSARPTMMPDGMLLDDSLAAQLGDGEPLSAIVEAGADTPVTWAVDPDLLDTVATMADGYRVASPSGPVDGSQPNSEAAQDWRQRFNQVTEDRGVWVLPYAMPDIGALITNEPRLAAELSRQSLAAADGTARTIGGATSALSWLDGASVTDRVLSTLADAGAETVIVPGGAVETEGRPALGEFTVGEQTLGAVVTDAGLSDAVADAVDAADPQAGAIDLQQRWIGETAMIAIAAARDDTEPGLMVAAPPPRWRPHPAVAQGVIDTWTSVQWIEPVDLAELEETGGSAEVSPAPTEGTNLLPEANVAATAQLRDDAAQYTTLLADPEDVTGGLTLATLRSASTGWRDDPAAGVAYAGAITGDLTARFDQISVTVPESVTLSSRAGSFPLTVTNELPDAVNVKLEVRSANVDRLRISEVETQELLPGEQRLVSVTAEAAANGRVPIEVQLTTDDGEPIGVARPTVVNATDYGTIGWIIVGAAGALFAAAIVRRTVRSRRQGAVEPEDDPADGGALDAVTAEAKPAREAAR